MGCQSVAGQLGNRFPNDDVGVNSKSTIVKPIES